MDAGVALSLDHVEYDFEDYVLAHGIPETLDPLPYRKVRILSYAQSLHSALFRISLLTLLFYELFRQDQSLPPAKKPNQPSPPPKMTHAFELSSVAIGCATSA